MSRTLRNATCFMIGFCLFSPIGFAQTDNRDADQAELATADAETAKQKVLAWIDDYREDQVLFHDKDIAKLRKDLADDSPEEAIRWWNKTAKIRAALESPEWQETSEWLREFLKVQAIFSDEEIDDIRKQAKDAAEQQNTSDFKDVLAQIERYRANLVQGAATDRALREHRLQLMNAYKQESVAQRAPAVKAAAFGTTNTTQPVIRDRRVPTAPLINSLDVARWSVMRNFWRW